MEKVKSIKLQQWKGRTIKCRCKNPCADTNGMQLREIVKQMISRKLMDALIE